MGTAMVMATVCFPSQKIMRVDSLNPTCPTVTMHSSHFPVTVDVKSGL